MPQLPSSGQPRNQYHQRPQTFKDIAKSKIIEFNQYGEQCRDWFFSLSILKKTLIIIGFIILFIIGILFIIFHSYIIQFLIYLSDSWSQFKYGDLIIFTLIFLVGFPPLIGFSALSFLTGMIYGFPQGWPLLASASILGSLCSFLVFKYLLTSRAKHLISINENFKAFSEILKDDSNSLMLLILIRLCPLPYSLSNGALASIPDLSITTFFLASLITSPKLLIHLFVGHKLKQLGNEDSNYSTKLIDFISILITGTAATLTTYIIYVKMQQKLNQMHSDTNHGIDDNLVFGNFEDDLELGSANSRTEIELNSNDYDTDNFIIESDEEDRKQVKNID